MKRLFLDSGAVDRLARDNFLASAHIKRLRDEGYWPPRLHTVVLAECVSGRQRDDAPVNRFIKTCNVVEELPKRFARRAGELRTKTKKGSVVDALLVAMAEHGGTVLTDDSGDIRALASNAHGATVVSSKPAKS